MDIDRVLRERETFKNLRAAIESVRTIETWDKKKVDRIVSELYIWYGQVYKIGWDDGIEHQTKRIK